MPEPGTRFRFVLKRLNWAQHYGGNRSRRPGEVAVASFDTFAEADAERAAREDGERKKVNPFACGDAVQYWSHLDEPRLRDWLMDRGIDPPEPKKDKTTDWPAWWKKHQKALGSEKRAVVWEALDKERFFAVREEPVRPVGYAVIEINWEYNDENYSADEEGGRVLKVFRARARAEAECAARNAAAREEWSFVDEFAAGFEDDLDEDEDFGMAAFDMTGRIRHRRGLTDDKKLGKREGLYNSSADAIFYEVIEVTLEGLE